MHRYDDETGAPHAEAALSTDHARRDVLETALRTSLGPCAVVWLAGVLYLLRLDMPLLALAAAALYAWGAVLLLLPFLSVGVRAAAALAPVFAAGAFLLIRFGPLGPGMIWPFAAITIAASMFRRTVALAGAAAYAVLLTAIGIAIELGVLPWAEDATSATMWWVTACSAVLAAAITIPVIIRQSRNMERSLAHSRAASRELEAERARLVAANEELKCSIGELKRAEAERARLIAAVEHAGTPIAILDAAWRVEYVNPAFERTTGFTREHAIGMPVDVVGGIGDEAAVRAEIDARVAEGGAWAGRMRNRRRDGTAYEAEGTVAPIGGDARMGYIAVLRDVSREAGLEAQLRHSQKLEALGTLAGGIAHDFNNLLVPIIGCTEAVRERLPQDDEARQLLGDVRAAADRARDLVSQILTISRRTEPSRDPRLVAPVVREAVRLLRAMLPAGIRIEERIDDAAGAVRADATELHQIIMNLASNAYHAMRRSGGMLTVTLESLPHDRVPPDSLARPASAYVRITVGDTGVGMDEATLARVFDPFFTTKPPGEGTGLGLPMVHGAVSALGGAIDVRSWPGAGTIVRIDLPCSADPPTAAAPAEAPAEPGGGLHILLVDDEPAVRRVAHRMLERSGFRVTAVASGDEALARFRVRPTAYDVVLTDFNMPDMTGLDLACRLHAVRADTPVVLASGYIDADAHAAAERCGVRRVVHKPFSPSEIASAVAAAVRPQMLGVA